MNIDIEKKQDLTSYRKIAIASWRHPRNPNTYAMLDLPVDPIVFFGLGSFETVGGTPVRRISILIGGVAARRLGPFCSLSMRISNLHLLIVLLLSCSMSLSGCASSPKAVISVSVLHNRIETSHVGSGETIIVKPFIDNRKESQRPYIGETHEPVNAYPLPPVLIPVPSGRYIVLKNGANVAEILTGYFAEALKGAGYKVLFSTPSSLTQLDIASIPPNAVLEGEINEFWLTPSWTTKHLIRLQLKLYNKEGNHLLWEKELRAEYSEFIGLWSPAAFEEVIKKALDKALHQAAKGFVSDEFQQKVSENPLEMR